MLYIANILNAGDKAIMWYSISALPPGNMAIVRQFLRTDLFMGLLFEDNVYTKRKERNKKILSQWCSPLEIVKFVPQLRTYAAVLLPEKRQAASPLTSSRLSYRRLRPPDLRLAWKRCVTYIHDNEMSSVKYIITVLTRSVASH